MLNHAAQLLHAFLVGRDHRAQVGQILLDVARRILARTEERDRLLLAQSPFFDQQEVVDQHAFLFDHLAVGRHRTGGDAADVGVVPARTDVEQDTLARVVEHRRDHRDVGQVRAAVVGRVEHVDIAR